MDLFKYALFVAICAVTGAVAYVVSRLAFDKKKSIVPETPKEDIDPIELLTPKKGTHKFFQKGMLRLVHVNRHAIQANLKHNKNYPTCIVVDNGTKEEFHSVVIRGSSILKFDHESKTANVYLVTFSEIKGTIETNAPETFLELPEEIEQNHLSPKTLPFSDSINFKKQCRLVRRFEKFNSGRGPVKPEYLDRIDEYPLLFGEEGFIDIENQKKYVRQTFEYSTKIVSVPLEENDPGYQRQFPKC